MKLFFRLSAPCLFFLLLLPPVVNAGKLRCQPIQLPFGLERLNSKIDNEHFIQIEGESFFLGPAVSSNRERRREVKFFGVNLVGEANFPPKDQQGCIARNLRSLGVNIVRIHHVDLNDEVNPTKISRGSILRPLHELKSSPMVASVAATHLASFLTALKDEGIYVVLNLRTQNEFGLGEKGGALHVLSGENLDYQKRFANILFESLGLLKNPQLAMVEINNESSLTNEWLRGELKGISLKAKGLIKDYLSKCSGTVALFPRGSERDFESPFNFTLQEKRSIVRCFEKAESIYYSEMTKHLRKIAGFNLAVTGTQSTHAGFSVPVIGSSWSYLDSHFYLDHPLFKGEKKWNSSEWKIKVEDGFGRKNSAYFNLALSRWRGRPFVVSEFNQAWMSPHAFKMPIQLALVGALQGWNGLIFHQYSSEANWALSGPNGFSLLGDRAKMISVALGAKIFREAGPQQPLETKSFLLDEEERTKIVLAGRKRWDVYRDFKLVSDTMGELLLQKKVGLFWNQMENVKQLESQNAQVLTQKKFAESRSVEWGSSWLLFGANGSGRGSFVFKGLRIEVEPNEKSDLILVGIIILDSKKVLLVRDGPYEVTLEDGRVINTAKGSPAGFFWSGDRSKMLKTSLILPRVRVFRGDKELVSLKTPERVAGQTFFDGMVSVLQ